MKTVAFNGSGRNVTRVLFVLAALGGFYLLRRQGKSIGQIAAIGTTGFKAAQDLIGRVAPSVGSSIGAQSSQSSSVATSAQI